MLQMLTTSNKAQNLKRAETMIKQAAHDGAQVIMLPECFVCPYQRDFMVKAAEPITVGHERATTANLLSELAKETNTYIIGGSFPEETSISND